MLQLEFHMDAGMLESRRAGKRRELEDNQRWVLVFKKPPLLPKICMSQQFQQLLPTRENICVERGRRKKE